MPYKIVQFAFFSAALYKDILGLHKDVLFHYYCCAYTEPDCRYCSTSIIVFTLLPSMLGPTVSGPRKIQHNFVPNRTGHVLKNYSRNVQITSVFVHASEI